MHNEFPESWKAKGLFFLMNDILFARSLRQTDL